MAIYGPKTSYAVDRLAEKLDETNRLLAIIAEALVNMDRRAELERLYANRDDD